MSKIAKYQNLAKVAKKEDSRAAESSDVQAQQARALRPVPAPEMNAVKDGASFLQSFLKATPLMNMFEHIAERTYGGDKTHLKIAKLKVTHNYYYQACVWVDFAIRAGVTVLLIIIAADAAFKVIS